MTQANARGSELIKEGFEVTRSDGQKVRLSLHFLTAVDADGRTVIRDVAVGDDQVRLWEEHGVLPHNTVVELGEGANGPQQQPRAAYVEKGHGREAGWSLTTHTQGVTGQFTYAGFIPTPKASGDPAQDQRNLAVAEARVNAWTNQGRVISEGQVVPSSLEAA